MAQRLSGDIAIVTGADSGIGRAIAEEFAREGADVAIIFRTDENGAEETRRLVEAAGRRAFVSRTDVTDLEAVAQLFRETVRELGTPTILVNNAGIGDDGQPVWEKPAEAWDRVIKTDLYGPFYCCQRFINIRKEAGGSGKIINITSVHEEIPSPGNAAYGAAKGGLRNLTRSLALELAPDKININNIAPGMIRTPMTRRKTADPETEAEYVRNIPWGRAGEPDEVARLAVYLASDDAEYVTGQSFTIDGGLEMAWGQGT